MGEGASNDWQYKHDNGSSRSGNTDWMPIVEIGLFLVIYWVHIGSHYRCIVDTSSLVGQESSGFGARQASVFLQVCTSVC